MQSTTVSDAGQTGQVVAAPLLWLRLEGGVALVASTYLYARAPGSWWVFAVCFFTPDLSFFAYLLGPRPGAVAYNCVHTYVAPALLAGVANAAGWPLDLALIWTAHIGLDRLLGYGLKYPTAFQDTHLGRLGKPTGSRANAER